MYHFPPDQQWAHPTQSHHDRRRRSSHAPYAGEGVNQAMQDALELYEALCEEEHKTIRAALTAFEKKMLPRAAAITRESLISTEMMHSPEGLENLLHFFNRGPHSS